MPAISHRGRPLAADADRGRIDFEPEVALRATAPTLAAPFRLRLPATRLGVEVLLTATAIAWALNMSAIKYALGHGFAPLAFSAPRVFLAGLALTALAWRRTHRLPAIRRADLAAVILIGLVGTFLNQLAFVYGLSFANAATVALVSASGPVLAGLLASRSRTEIPRRVDWLAAFLSFGGVAIIVCDSGIRFGAGFAGVLLALLASISWAVYAVGSTRLLRRYSPIHLNAATVLAGSIPLLAVSIEPLSDQRWSAITPLAWAAWSYSLVVCYLAATVLWLFAVRRVGVTHAALYQNAQTFFAVIFAVLLLSETLRPLELLGGAVIAASIMLTIASAPTAGTGSEATRHTERLEP